jgi:hypothetical protein
MKFEQAVCTSPLEVAAAAPKGSDVAVAAAALARAEARLAVAQVAVERTTPEIMKAWGAWFESIADRTIDNSGFTGGREISASGTTELPWGMESITGYTIIEAESLDEAGKIARDNPYIASIRVYEIREM